jgi:hypothetical protein
MQNNFAGQETKKARCGSRAWCRLDLWKDKGRMIPGALVWLLLLAGFLPGRCV